MIYRHTSNLRAAQLSLEADTVHACAIELRSLFVAQCGETAPTLARFAGIGVVLPANQKLMSIIDRLGRALGRA